MFRTLMATVLMLGTLSAVAVAQTGGSASNTPLEVIITEASCEDSSEGSDEPYLVIFGADFRAGGSAGRVWTTTSASEVDDNETRQLNLQIWSLDGENPAPIASEDDYIFLVALMEEDDPDNRRAINSRVFNATVPELGSYKASGMTRDAMVKVLKEDMEDAIEKARHRDDNEDDQIGDLFEIRFRPNQLEAARAGNPVEVTNTFSGTNSRYSLKVKLQ